MTKNEKESVSHAEPKIITRTGPHPLQALYSDPAWREKYFTQFSKAELVHMLANRKPDVALQPAWQDIATAPDNVAILVFIPHREHYGPGIYRAMHANFPGRSEPHWHSSGVAVGRDIDVSSLPTHWMPLPAPPEAK